MPTFQDKKGRIKLNKKGARRGGNLSTPSHTDALPRHYGHENVVHFNQIANMPDFSRQDVQKVDKS